MKDLVEREGIFYKKFTDVPFTGEEQKEFEIWEKKRPSGQLPRQRTVIGKRDPQER